MLSSNPKAECSSVLISNPKPECSSVLSSILNLSMFMCFPQLSILQTSWEQLLLPLGPFYPIPSGPHQNPFHFKQTEVYGFSEAPVGLGSAASVFMKRISQSAFSRGGKSLQGAMPQTFPPNHPELEGLNCSESFHPAMTVFMGVM